MLHCAVAANHMQHSRRHHSTCRMQVSIDARRKMQSNCLQNHPQPSTSSCAILGLNSRKLVQQSDTQHLGGGCKATACRTTHCQVPVCPSVCRLSSCVPLSLSLSVCRLSYCLPAPLNIRMSVACLPACPVSQSICLSLLLSVYL